MCSLMICFLLGIGLVNPASRDPGLRIGVMRMALTVDLGGLGEMRIMVFKNEKAEENHPDWAINLVLPDTEKEE